MSFGVKYSWFLALIIEISLTRSQEKLCETSDSRGRKICLSEDCVLASATILSSLDRSVDPCEDFYQYACGGWAQSSALQNTDRFQVVDKRNQILIHDLLMKKTHEEDSFSAMYKTKKFYRACVSEDERRNLPYLQSLVDYSGGWSLSGEQNTGSIDLNKRLQILQNEFGLNVLFTWGVVEHEQKHRLALLAGGWSDGFIETNREEYLKLMSVFTLYLSQATETHDIRDEESSGFREHNENQDEYTYNIEFNFEDNDTFQNDSSIDISYDYEDILTGEDSNRSVPYFFSFFDWINRGYYSDEGNELTNSGDTSSPEESSNASKVKSDRTWANSDGKINVQEDEEEDFRILARSNNIKNSMSQVIDLEERLANLTTTKLVDRKDLTPLTIPQIQEDYPFINWTSFFKSAFKDLDEGFIDSNHEILVQKDYLRGVNDLFFSLNETVLVNYMTWRLLAAFYPNRPSDEIQRREQCLAETEDVFAPVVTAMYIQAKNSNKTEKILQQVDKMVDTMKEAFKNNLEKLLWMSPESQKAAETKLVHMIDLIGYPKYVLNSTWLNTIYSSIEIEDDFLMNVVAHKSFMRRQELKAFYQDYSRGNWADFMPNIATANAYYSQTSNTMIVPIAMLQPPLFWTRPQSLTFGAFGIIVAHEITHAFDDSGIKYDEFGSFKPLYDNETVKAFHDESDCIRRQYSRFELSGLEVDGNRTLGENIADHGGLKIAEIAYREWIRTSSDVGLPALDFVSDEQMFYLGYALPWCAVHTRSHLKSHVLNDEHAPEKFRVLGPLCNSEDFARAYNCPVGSKLNPKDKCRVW